MKWWKQNYYWNSVVKRLKYSYASKTTTMMISSNDKLSRMNSLDNGLIRFRCESVLEYIFAHFLLRQVMYGIRSKLSQIHKMMDHFVLFWWADYLGFNHFRCLAIFTKCWWTVSQKAKIMSICNKTQTGTLLSLHCLT